MYVLLDLNHKVFFRRYVLQYADLTLLDMLGRHGLEYFRTFEGIWWERGQCEVRLDVGGCVEEYRMGYTLLVEEVTGLVVGREA